MQLKEKKLSITLGKLGRILYLCDVL